MLFRRRAAKRRLVVLHVWQKRGQRWQCEVCCAVALSSSSLEKRKDEECPGKHASTRLVLANEGGHNLAQADVAGGPCFLCLACGAWATTQPRRLLAQCKGQMARTRAGAEALRAFERGRLPETTNPKKRGRRGPAPIQKVFAIEKCSETTAVMCPGPLRQPAAPVGPGSAQV